MTADFLPGFEPHAKAMTIISDDGRAVLDADVEKPRDDERVSVESTPLRWNSFRFRVEQFARSLSPSRLAAVARRSRFYRLPWLRLANEPDDDFLS